MNVPGGKLDGDSVSERVSPLAFGVAFAVLAALAAILLWRLGSSAPRSLLVCTMSPGIAAAGCTAALYYENSPVSLTRLATSIVFLEALMICLQQVDGWRRAFKLLNF